ncbi:hypothetical protein [Haloarcula marismortui]|uniref:Uncharacterized protein n=1 Tax=Haloarcula marismortui ATCC 33800 TaxID=662476 RepID=A0A8T8KU04_9EURY|nr:hypothetical protein [Haloarcula sinaiiensis]QUJ74763.1 hypothetical protein KDQ40_21810 [Haloarcula sinaiiensis ATCC 33800]
MSDATDLETLDIPDLGDVPSPQACREERDGRKTTNHINSKCPVCGAGPYNTFAKLRGHFGNMSDDTPHQNYDLRLEAFQ